MFCVTLPFFAYTFGPIWTNLLTQCTQLPVPVFCCFLFFRFSDYLKCPKNSGKIILKISVTEPSGRAKRGKEVHHQGPRRVPGAAPPWAAPGGLLAALWLLSMPPFAYIYPSDQKPLDGNPFPRNPLCSAAAA